MNLGTSATDSATSFPYPPLHLLQRTGNVGSADPERAYDEVGQEVRRMIEGILPNDWSWSGRRVLDFGCGAGRVMRQFAAETKNAEFWGCDIDVASIKWVQENLSPPFQAITCKEQPGLPFADGFFSVIYAMSVFTHLTEHASGWLLELRRTLCDGGLLVLTFLGEGMIQPLINEPWDEDRIGFNTVLHGNPWDVGGPLTFISPWWLKEHWGRAFDILQLLPYAARQCDGTPAGHGMALLRKRPGHVSIPDIDKPVVDEPREIRALQHNRKQLANELIALRHAQLRVAAEQQAVAQQQAVIQEPQTKISALEALLSGRLREIEQSTTWRAAALLRSIGAPLPPSLRRNLRRLAKAAWWAATPHRIPARLRLLSQRRHAVPTCCAVGEATSPVAENGVPESLVPPIKLDSLPAHGSSRPEPTREVKILQKIKRGMKILEIGGSFSPILARSDGWDVFSLDHLGADELRAKYADDPVVDIDRIQTVDFICRDGPLDAAIGPEHAGTFDAIIGSHVIEHFPDLIAFFNSAGRILKPSGVLSLVVPDKRFCFDYFQPVVLTGDVLEAHAEGRTRHSRKSLFNATSYTVKAGDRIAWTQERIENLSCVSGDLQHAHQQFTTYQDGASDPYLDFHGWYFTPSSFRLICLELAHLRLIPFEEVSFHGTAGCEFYVTLRHSDAPIFSDIAGARIGYLKGILREIREQTDYLVSDGVS
jgi:SAM-dependent methyltransferase